VSQQTRSTFVVTDPSEILEALVGLKEVRVLHYRRHGPEVELMIEQVVDEVRCPSCGGIAQVKERPVVSYVDLPVYGAAMRLSGRSTGWSVSRTAARKRAGCSPRVPRLTQLPAEGLSAGNFPDLLEPMFGSIPMPWPASEERPMWGHQVMDRHSILIRAARLRVRVPEPFQSWEIEDQFESFFNVASDWLRAWTGLSAPSVPSDSSDPALLFVRPRRNRGGVHFAVGRAYGSIAAYAERSATRTELEAAIVCGINRYGLPPPQSLLYRASWDRTRADFRQAVIDACTASEVALATTVRSKLADMATPVAVIDNALKKADGVVDLYRLWVILGARPQASEGRVMNELAAPRNDAAHGGAMLGLDIADKAIDAASKIVEGASPLPDPRRVTALARRFGSAATRTA